MTVTEQTFPCTASALYSVLIDPITYPKWLVGAKRIREVSPDWPAAGSWFRHVVGFGPLAIADKTTVRELDGSTVLELLVRARPVLEAVVRFELTAAGGGCSLRMTETPVGVFALTAPLTEPMIRKRNERSLHRLYEVVSGSRPPEPSASA